jgi:flavorubredoxin
MTDVTEIAPDLYRISTHVPKIDLQFAQFLVVDDEPLLFHTGLRAMYPEVRQAVERLIDPARIRWIGFSHFEADECGALNEWLTAAPRAQAICSVVGAYVNINDFAIRPAQPMRDEQVLTTGKSRFRFLQTPHVPHCWDAGLMFEETSGTLLCSDLFHQSGQVEAVSESAADVVERHRQVLLAYQAGPFANYMPYTDATDRTLRRLALLKPTRLATMHGSTFAGDGEQALRDLARMTRDLFGPGQAAASGNP